MTTPPPELDLTQRAALALFHATRAGRDTSAAALAEASGLSVDDVLRGLAPLADESIVIACPVQPRTSPPPSSEWAALREQLQFEMLPWLPSILEGLLDYSPADDEARVQSAIGDERPGSRVAEKLAEAVDLPADRISEALTRLEHREIEREEAMGTRMRFVLEVTFPNYRVTHDEPPGYFMNMLDRWMRAIEANGVVPCRDVRIWEGSNVSFRRDEREYRAWRHAKEPDVASGGPGLAGLL